MSLNVVMIDECFLFNFKTIVKMVEKTQISDFDIVKKIGTGAYGKVFLARSKTSNDLVAIK